MSDLNKPLALQAKAITKSFNGVPALKGVSLNLYAGEVHGLNGENGAGKSTLIKIITGFYQSDGGELLLEGAPVTFARPLDAQRSGISTVYQEINLIPERTVADNILLGREPRRAGILDRKAGVQQVQAILSRYGLDIDPRAKVSSLGLGMQQMVAIVRSVAFEAKVVILDEPTSALNGKEIETLFGVIRQLRSEGAAVVFVSHRMSELYELCDRFTVLRDGEFVMESTPDKLPRVELVKAMLGGVDLGEADMDRGAARQRIERLAREDVGLSVRNLSWSTRVRNVSFDVKKGEIVGLLGLLGSGRTETCKALFGAVKAESGEVHVDGVALTRATPSRALQAGLAYLSEDRRTEGIFAGLSIKENLTAATLDSLAKFGFVSLKAQNKVVKHSAPNSRSRQPTPNSQSANSLAVTSKRSSSPAGCRVNPRQSFWTIPREASMLVPKPKSIAL